jgi:hypothetical protein
MSEDTLRTALISLISTVREVRGQNTVEFMQYLQQEIGKAMLAAGVAVDPATERERTPYIMKGATP